MFGSVVLKDEASGALDKIERKAEQAEAKLGKFSNKMADIGKSATNTGKTLSKKLTAPIVALGGVAVKIGMDFEASMSEVAAITGATGVDFDNLSAKARELGNSTAYSASEAAEAMTALGLAGWEAEDIMSGVGDVLFLAGAGGVELEAAAGMAASAMAQFGIDAADASRATDILAFAQANSNTTVTELSDALVNAGSMAASMGYSIEDTSAVLGILADSGLKAGRSGSALAAAFRDMKKNSEDGAIAIGNSSVAIVDANGDYRDFIDIAIDVKKATEGMEMSQRDAALSTIFGDTAIKAMLPLLSETEDSLRSTQEAFNDASGAAKGMYGIMTDNLQGSIDEMKSALEESAVQLSEILIPIVRNVIDTIASWAQSFNGLGEGTQKIILVVAGLIAAIGPALIIFGKFATAISAISGLFAAGTVGAGILSGAMAALGAVIAFITSPIGLVIAAVVAVIAIFTILYKKSEIFRDFIHSMFEGIEILFCFIVDGITTYVNTLVKVWSTAFGLILNTVSRVGNSIENVATTIFNGVKNAIIKPIEVAKNTVSNIVDSIKGFFSNMKLSIPKIKLPTLPKPKITGGFSLVPPSVPKISWNAEGGIFSKPTIFNSSQGLQGVGEKGAEAITPLDKLRDWIGGWMNVKNDNIGDSILVLNKTLTSLLSPAKQTTLATNGPSNITLNITGDWTVDSDERQEGVIDELTKEMDKYFRIRGDK